MLDKDVLIAWLRVQRSNRCTKKNFLTVLSRFYRWNFLNIFPVDNRGFGKGMNFCRISICEIFVLLEKVYDIN